MLKCLIRRGTAGEVGDMAKERKLDIFAAMKAIDRHDSKWLSNQPSDAQKEFAPLVAIRWAATHQTDSESAARMLWLVNERANRHLFDFNKHPDLIYRLLASCGTGQQARRSYLSPRPQHRDSNKALDLLRQQNLLANHRELAVLLSLYDRQGFANFAADCGKQPDEVKEIMKSYDRSKST